MDDLKHAVSSSAGVDRGITYGSDWRKSPANKIIAPPVSVLS